MQVVHAAVFDAVPPGEAARSIGGVYDALIRQQPGSGAAGFVSDAEFWDVGTVEDYWRTSTALATRSDMADLGVGASLRMSIDRRVSRGRFCGTMWRLEPRL